MKGLAMIDMGALLEQQEAVAAQIAAAKHEFRAEAVAQVRQLAAQFELTAAEVGFGASVNGPASKPRKVSGKPPLPPKFRDPETGKTWSGRGKRPLWFNGRDPGQFSLGA